MSQTTGQAGNDPEKDQWLKQFSGLPDDFETDELTTDRPYMDPVRPKRGDGVTFEGQINSLGEAAVSVAEDWDQKGKGHRRIRRIAGYIAVASLGIAVLGSIIRDIASI